METILFLFENKRKLSRIERQIQTYSLISRTSAMQLFLPDNSLFLIRYSKLWFDYQFKHFSRRISIPHFKHFSRRILFENWEKRKMRSSGSKSKGNRRPSQLYNCFRTLRISKWIPQKLDLDIVVSTLRSRPWFPNTRSSARRKWTGSRKLICQIEIPHQKFQRESPLL